ncbi:MAG: hypothetical protein OXB84_00545 [Halobacteriovoraceae bacterium]|nr:hypothetical protein [Halobacteriovoraceae bacterium]
MRENDRDRLFFHDLINHIHGMLLYLDYQTENRRGLDVSQCRKITKELQILQTLIQDHFGYSHKNLPEDSLYKDISTVEKELEGLIKNFLPGKSYDFQVKGEVAGKINCSVFYRVMGNIVKNIAEAQGRNVLFQLETKRDGIYFLVKNRTKSNNKTVKQKSGLLSIGKLCESAGGSFDFFRENDFWVNRVFLPWC